MSNFTPLQGTKPDPNLTWRRADGMLQPSEKLRRLRKLQEAELKNIGGLIDAGLLDLNDPDVFVESTKHLEPEGFDSEIINGGLIKTLNEKPK